MFNYDTFDYVSIGAPNVLVEIDKGATPPEGFTNSLATRLLLELAQRRPGWKFRVIVGPYGPHTGGETASVVGVSVIQGQEEIGTFSTAHYPRRGVDITSRSISRSMDRKSYKFTSDLTVARKLVEKHFAPLPRDVKVTEAMRSVSTKWTTNMNTAITKDVTAFRELASRMETAVRSDMDTFAPLLATYGITRAELDRLTELSQARGVFSSLRSHNGLTTVVVLDGYVFAAPYGAGADKSVMYAPGEAPADISAALAVLAMAPDGTPVPDLGAKVAENQYVVVRTDTP
jgi:hypothetical protein